MGRHGLLSSREAVDLWVYGWSQIEIAAVYGVSSTTVGWTIEKQAGVGPRRLRRDRGWIGRLSPATVRQIQMLAAQGHDENGRPWSGVMIAAELGVSASAVQQVTRNLPGRQQYFSLVQREEIRAAYVERGCSLQDIARVWGVNERAIRRTLERLGVLRRSQGRPPRGAAGPDWARIVELRKGGASHAEIRRELRVSSRTVHRVLAEVGLVRHRRLP